MSQLKNKTTLNLILFFSIFALGAAYFVQYILGHKPCNLCLIERLPYISSIIIILLGLILKKFENSNDEIIIFSDSKNTVNQLNHEFAINNEELRSLAREAWSLMANFSNLTLTWVPRSKNLAGKMLGS